MRVFNVVLAAISLIFSAVSVSAETTRSLPVIVTASVPKSVQENAEIPLTIRVSNQLNNTIRVSGFTITPNDWHGETAWRRVLDIYRDKKLPSIFLKHPFIEAPVDTSGPGARPVSPGESLDIVTDLRKWKVLGGWIPGHYKFRVGVDGIIIDEYTTASILSDSVQFTIVGE